MTGCTQKTIRTYLQIPSQSGPRDFIDLQPGSRLRVVTPILRSGGYKLKTRGDEAVTGMDGKLEIVVKSGKDFLGYELAYYLLETRFREHFRLRLVSATIMENGAERVKLKSIAPLPVVPGYTKFLRLLFLTRVSNADHDMGMLAANRKTDLDALTRRVLENPDACRSYSGMSCSWIPAGVAVTPESLPEP